MERGAPDFVETARREVSRGGTNPDGLKFNGRKALSQCGIQAVPWRLHRIKFGPASSGARPSASPACVNSYITTTAEAPATIISPARQMNSAATRRSPFHFKSAGE